MTKAQLAVLVAVSGATGTVSYVAGSTQSGAAYFKPTTAVVHAVDVRQEPGLPATLVVYGAVQDSKGRTHDLGATTCAISESDRAELRALLTEGWVHRCSGKPQVHALDLRRFVAPRPDGGAMVAYSARAYGYGPAPDGGTTYSPGHECAGPPPTPKLFDGLARRCFLAGQFGP